MLNPTLAANGGATKTHSLVASATNPAIDKGDNVTCAIALPGGAGGQDQRGLSRSDGHCDVGAVETQRYPLTTGTAGRGTGTVSPGGTYTEATVAQVAALPSGGSIFAGWSVDGGPAGSANPLAVTMDAAHTVVATFARPATTVALTVGTAGAGAGTVGRGPAGTGSGPFAYPPGAVVTLTPQPAPGSFFVGWALDGAVKGWASPATLTMDADHSLVATFAPAPAFADIVVSGAQYTAIVSLAARGTILGYDAQHYGPGDGVQRAQMAALIARATPAGPDTPPAILAPPACAAGSWDCEDWGFPSFGDRDGLVASLWRDVGALEHYGVAHGLDTAHYGPTRPVTYAETIAFITRAMKTKSYWVAQPSAPLPAGVPAVLTNDVRTFAFYTQPVGGIPAPPADWNAGATRGWFARALWAALDSYWDTDGPLPDGRPAGGMVP